MITCELFDEFNGKKIYAYTLKDKNVCAEILTFGGIIRSLKINDTHGKETDVVLGYDCVKDYSEASNYFGATIGRVCNRIGGCTFTYNGVKYNTDNNDNGNTLHGGFNGFNQKFYDAYIDGEKLVLSSYSADGEGGFDGNLVFSVTFYLKDGGLNIEYKATCDKDTPINLTNHSYFNLDGEGSDNIFDTTLFIDSTNVTPTDKSLIPKGYKDIQNTAFDFSKPKKIGKDFKCDEELFKICNGYDINYCLKGKGLRKVAWAKSEKSSIKLEVFTNAIGIQFYSGNFLNGEIGKGEKEYKRNSAFCLETQGYPNAVNNSDYPSIIVKKGNVYSTKTIYKLSIDK